MNSTPPIDLSKYANEGAQSSRVRRVLWSICDSLLFRWSPRRAFGWRRFLLRTFGAQLARTSYVYPSVRIRDPKLLRVGEHSSIGPDVEIYSVDEIEIGNHCTISMQSFLCTGSHDIGHAHMRLTHAPIHVQDGAWVCARAFVGPGVVVGQGAVIAACAVVTKDVEPWTVVAGNPAVFRKRRTIQVDS